MRAPGTWLGGRAQIKRRPGRVLARSRPGVPPGGASTFLLGGFLGKRGLYRASKPGVQVHEGRTPLLRRV